MIIGIDFDNTIANYDGVFYEAALIQKLIPKEIGTSKGCVRDYLRSIGKEEEWTKLQGFIYGSRMDLAKPYNGVHEFFSSCIHPTYIISHKTRHPFLGPQYDLHKAASDWLASQKFQAKNTFFELTLDDKLARIAKQNCTHFIDDLPELFAEKNFPNHVEKILFDPTNAHPNHPTYRRFTSWKDCSTYLLHR